MQKQKTSASGKIQNLEAHVFGNAKLCLDFPIHNFKIQNVFFKNLGLRHISTKKV